MNLISIRDDWTLSPAVPLPNTAVILLAEIPTAVRSAAAILALISTVHLTWKLSVPLASVCRKGDSGCSESLLPQPSAADHGLEFLLL